ncbi:MAG: nitroreductase [Gammaproteobacteria bacterium]|nr:nitroreductase [Gammaproteobacteria bacterium]
MNVTDALYARKSIRNFLDKPVPNTLLAELLEKAARAPSGGNLQPWRVYVINGPSMDRFLAFNKGRPASETPEYPVYPPNLKEPYRTSRFELGEAMYAKLGIPREDKPARLAHLARNMCFFDAPAAIFCYVDRVMGLPQWSDLGMFLQSFMLVAEEAGLNTCAQEAWASRPDTVTQFVEAPAELMLFCGVAVGYADPVAPVNQLESARQPLSHWATFIET